jgi:hypothetical protein
MRHLLIIAFLVFSPFALPNMLARPQTKAESPSAENHVITVSGSGQVEAKPDVGILVMTIQSASPISEEAVAANGRKAKAVESALAALGYPADGFKITPVTLENAGGPRFGPMQPAIPEYHASQYVYVFFQPADLKDVAQLTVKSAATIEALRKAGAVPGNQGALIVYAIKDSTKYERQALQKAISQARGAAQEMAAGLGAQITGLRKVSGGNFQGDLMSRPGLPSLEGLPYHWYSTARDEIKVSTSVTVEYDFK